MNHDRWRLAVCAGLLVLVACRPPASPTSKVELGDGWHTRAREDYLQTCAPCHGADGRGGARTGGSSVDAPDLTRLRERPDIDDLHAYVVEVIAGERTMPAHGPREMPVWRRRFEHVGTGAEAVAALHAERRLDGLASYVESLQTPVGR